MVAAVSGLRPPRRLNNLKPNCYVPGHIAPELRSSMAREHRGDEKLGIFEGNRSTNDLFYSIHAPAAAGPLCDELELEAWLTWRRWRCDCATFAGAMVATSQEVRG